jgi:8-oxo-dGTP diphosphatase
VTDGADASGRLREWQVGGALIESSCAGLAGMAGLAERGPGRSVLLVENLRRNGTSDWTPPGGVIDQGESLVRGLAREVAEETGLVVARWEGPVYEIEAHAPGLGWTLRVEVHRAVEATGELRIGDDPDGIVVDATWADDLRCGSLLVGTHPWVREPLLEWLAEGWEGTRRFRYRIEGSRPDDLAVERL